MATQQHARHSAEQDGEDEVYVRSPLTAAEEALQLLPGSRFLNTREFKRVYLGLDAAASSSRGAEQTHASPAAALSGTRLAQSHNPTYAPRRPLASAASAPLRRGRGRGVTRRLRQLYGGTEAALRAPSTPPPSPAVSAGGAGVWRLDPSPSAALDMPGVAAGALRDAHPHLPHQVRTRVRSARAAAAPSPAAQAPSSSGAFCTEDAWLALRRELEDKKREAHTLQQQLRRAHVVIRTLHCVPEDAVADPEDVGAAAAAAPPPAAPAAAAPAEPAAGESAEAKPAEPPRPREYWQRRAYFLGRQNEELQAEVEQLRGDTRTSKVHALLHELEVVRAELVRFRRHGSGATASRWLEVTPVPHEAASEAADGDAPTTGEEGVALAGSVRPRLLSGRSAVPFSLATAVDEAFLRQKDEAIRDLQERLRLLSQQYQRADAERIAVTRQLEDTTHRHTTLQAEWKALSRLPQELARTQQQLAVAQARLVDSDRAVEAFRQLFDTLESPTTLRAVVEERDHLVELLRQRQLSEAALRDDMKATQEQALQAAARRFEEQHGEALAMAHDREAQQCGVAQALHTKVAALERQLEAQREAYETQLAELAQAHEAELTERLLESVRQPPVGVVNVAASVSALASAAVSPLPGSPDGGPLRLQQPTAALLPGLADSPLSISPASGSASRQSRGTESVASSARRVSDSASLSVSFVAAAASAPRHGDDEDDATAAAAPDAVSSTLSSVTDSEADAEEDVAAASLSSSVSAPGSRKPSRDGAPASQGVDIAVRQEWVADSGDDVDSGSDSDSATSSGSDASGTASTLSSAASSAMKGEAKGGAALGGSAAVGSPVDGDGDETPEKDSGPSTNSSLASVGHPFPMPAAAAAAREAVTAASSARAAPAVGKATPPATPAGSHRFVMDLPAAPIAVAPPTSILINRSLVSAPIFTRHLRAVVHSPTTSTAPTASATELTQTQQTLTSTSDPRSGSDDQGEGSYSEGSSGSRESSSSSGVSGTLSGAGALPAAAAGDGVVAVAKQGSSVYSGDRVSADSPITPALGLPRVGVVAHSTPPSPPLGPAQPSSAAATSLQSGGTPPSLSQPSSPRLSPPRTSAKSPPALSSRGVPIPSPPAVTPVVASNLYPPRPSSSFLLFGGASEDEFGRGGANSRPTTADQNTSFDLSPHFSGNASFDFVGPLAERHRLEEMQNVSGASSQQPSPRSVGAASGVSAFSSGAPQGRSAPPGSQGMGTGASGLRRTPSPPLVLVAAHSGSAVPVPADDDASGGSASASALEVSVPDGDDDDDTASSISAERVTAGTRERQEAPPRRGRLVYAGTTASGGIAFTTPRGEPVTASLSPLPPRPATTTGSSGASSLKRSPIPANFPPDDNTPMSLPLDASAAGSVAERPIPAAVVPPPPPATSVPSPPPLPPSSSSSAVPPPPAAAVPSRPPPPPALVPSPPTPAAPLAPLPPMVAVPSPPPPQTSAPPAAPPLPAGLAPLPPRVEVPQPPAGE